MGEITAKINVLKIIVKLVFYHHHQEVCLFSVFRYCQSREGIESLFLIERLWREEVCGEKENLSEMFLVFKQLLRSGGGGQGC